MKPLFISMLLSGALLVWYGESQAMENDHGWGQRQQAQAVRIGQDGQHGGFDRHERADLRHDLNKVSHHNYNERQEERRHWVQAAHRGGHGHGSHHHRHHHWN